MKVSEFLNANKTQTAMPKSLFKYQLAAAAGVSKKTLNTWLANDDKKLFSLGFRWSQRTLPPSVVDFLCKKYVIVLDE